MNNSKSVIFTVLFFCLSIILASSGMALEPLKPPGGNNPGQLPDLKVKDILPKTIDGKCIIGFTVINMGGPIISSNLPYEPRLNVIMCGDIPQICFSIGLPLLNLKNAGGEQTYTDFFSPLDFKKPPFKVEIGISSGIVESDTSNNSLTRNVQCPLLIKPREPFRKQIPELPPIRRIE